MALSQSKILIAGIGNIFLGDDAFGCEVIQHLRGMALPENVRMKDFGIRGMDLAYALLEDFAIAILIDAVPRQERPGTVFLIEPEMPRNVAASPEIPLIDMHAMDPGKVLRLVSALAAQNPALKKILLVGCEPTPLDPEAMAMGLSPEVRAAVPEAARMVQSLLQEFAGVADSAATSSPVQSTI